MPIKGNELMTTCYPEVEDIREPIDNSNTLLSNKKAKELLAW